MKKGGVELIEIRSGGDVVQVRRPLDSHSVRTLNNTCVVAAGGTVLGMRPPVNHASMVCKRFPR